MDKPKIDWTKPIRFARGECGCCKSSNAGTRLRVVIVSNLGYQACLTCVCGRIWFFSSSGKSEEVGVTTIEIENIPEPKPEKWVNVWLSKDGSSACPDNYYRSKRKALDAVQGVDGGIFTIYCGTFQVKE